MAKSQNTSLTVRVQAKDGMFLGPDSYGGAIISITDLSSGKILASGFTNDGDSGTRSESYTPAATSSPIMTPTAPFPTYYLVVASSATVNFTASFNLTGPTLLEISAKIPLPEAQGDQHVSQTQWFIPGQALSSEPGFVMEVPGLWVQPEIIATSKAVKIRAKVTMMCGCEINDNSPWIPADFKVNTHIYFDGKLLEEVPMDFDVNSQFGGETTLKKGKYLAGIQAFQKSTGNMGVAKFDFVVK
ncbi:MAG: hypothetical protein DHS20C18_52300 [Saprospiraceae bacterium]|nr:MAG: hypothetical protein DHS20C18_52300 [Saprospiraceae bacterium]